MVRAGRGTQWYPLVWSGDVGSRSTLGGWTATGSRSGSRQPLVGLRRYLIVSVPYVAWAVLPVSQPYALSFAVPAVPPVRTVQVAL